MKFVYSDISGIFEWKQPYIPTLVIENQPLFRRFVLDIYRAIEGEASPAVLSVEDAPVEMARRAEMITDFIHFDINQKTLLNKMCGALEEQAVSAECYAETQQLLAQIENKISDWAFAFPCDIIASKLTVSALLKATGIAVRDDYAGESGDVERLIDYMELVREFDCDKLFITVNMRNYFSDERIEGFLQTVLSHEYKVLMLEAKPYARLKQEKRLTIDSDLCEF